ncbi:hypothetical protein QR685DRAFT_598461 [Neurospora intermedia]|uniref:Uncharacterized protein n=1 Tax=Neurospora intermedia TaxID=5142 RepID=A0ABR3D7T8_NEUIN
MSWVRQKYTTADLLTSLSGDLPNYGSRNTSYAVPLHAPESRNRRGARPPRQQQHAPALDAYLPTQPTPAKPKPSNGSHWQHTRNVCVVQLLPRLKSLAPAAWDAPKWKPRQKRAPLYGAIILVPLLKPSVGHISRHVMTRMFRRQGGS